VARCRNREIDKHFRRNLIPAFPFCCDKHSVKISDKWPGKEWEEEWSAGIAGRSHGSTNRWETWGYVRVCASSVEIQDRRGSTLSLRGEEIREPMGGKDNTTSLVTSRQALFHWAPDALYNAIPAPPPAPENRIPSGRQQRSRRLFHFTARSRALSFAVRLIHISASFSDLLSGITLRIQEIWTSFPTASAGRIKTY
jgi:hypothetical protein